VAAASDRLAMPSEDWIQRWKAAQFLYDWQTLIAGVLALVAAIGTIWATGSRVSPLRQSGEQASRRDSAR
jgi:hypothetical protein